MAQYEIKQCVSMDYTFCLIRNAETDEYFAGYDFMGGQEWSNSLCAYEMNEQEALQIKADLEAADADDQHEDEKEETKMENTITEATMEQRRELAVRIHKLNSLFTREYLAELENQKKEQEAIKKLESDSSSEIKCMALTADWNASVDLDCMTECIEVIDYLQNEEEPVELWQLAGISAMICQSNKDHSFDYSLPQAISDVLGIRFLKR